MQDLSNIEFDNQKWTEVQILQDHNTYSYTTTHNLNILTLF